LSNQDNGFEAAAHVFSQFLGNPLLELEQRKLLAFNY
jgi:hypothetical protein